VKVKKKRTAADYLAEQGFADLSDAVDPEEDEDTADTEVQSERDGDTDGDTECEMENYGLLHVLNLI
jgi:hypothetical protein